MRDAIFALWDVIYAMRNIILLNDVNLFMRDDTFAMRNIKLFIDVIFAMRKNTSFS
jgi:hypothetical protein